MNEKRRLKGSVFQDSDGRVSVDPNAFISRRDTVGFEVRNVLDEGDVDAE